MNIKKLFIFIFILLFGLSYINAVLDDAVGYYSLDTSDTPVPDSSGFGNTLAIIGTPIHITTGQKLGGGAYSLSSGDGFDIGDNYYSTADLTDFTLGAWVYLDTLNIEHQIIALEAIIRFEVKGDNTINFAVYDAGYDIINPINTLSSGQWYHIVVTRDNAFMKMYLNGLEIGSFSSPNIAQLDAFDRGQKIGLYYEGSGDFQGDIDESFIYNRSLTSTEVSDSYNSNIGFNPYTVSDKNLEFTDITADSITLVNNTFYNSIISFETTISNTSTNGLVNHSYFLNEGNKTIYSNDSLTGSFNLDLSDSINTIYFYGENNETNVTSSNYTFTVDRTPPVISFSGMVSEYNQASRVVNLLAQVTDNNPSTCEYKVNSDSYQSCNTSINLDTSSGILDPDSNNTLYVRAVDLAGNEVINSFSFEVIPYRMTFSFISVLSEEPVTNVTFNDIDFSNIIQTNESSTLVVYHDPGTYAYDASKPEYASDSGTYTISSVYNTKTIYLGPIFTITLKDEKTLGLFNLSNTDLVTLKITCDDESVIQQIITSNVHQVNITCMYKNFVYTVEAEDEYFRAIRLDETLLTFNVYLIDPLDVFLLKTFVIYDYLGDYQNPALTLYRNIGDDLVQITGDFVDVENKLTAYLLNNQQYVLKLTSDNLVERNLGTFDSVLPSGSTSYIQLLDIDSINIESTETINDIFIRAFKTGEGDSQNLYVEYNDTTDTTTFVELNVYSKNKYGILLYESDSTSSNVLFSMDNISQFNTSSFYIEVEYTTGLYGTKLYDTVVRYDDSIDLGVDFEYLNLNWVVLVALSFFALILTVSTANIGTIILLTLGGLTSLFGWFIIAEGLLSLAILIGVISFFRGDKK